MDAIVKCGNGGYGGYGYGNGKAQMNYHRQNTEYVTTVVTAINRMTVNDKQPGACGGAQKQASCKEEEAFVEHDKVSSYGGYHGGGGAVQKQAYKEKEEVFVEHDKKGSSYGGYHGGGAVHKTSSYKEEEVYEAGGGGYGGAAAGVKKQAGYKHQEETCGETDAHHGGSVAAVQTYAFDKQAAYGGAIGAAVQQQQQHGGYQKDAYGAAGKKNGYEKPESYSYGEYDTSYGGGGAVQTNESYKYKQQEKYGNADAGYGSAKKQGYKEASYGETGAGYGAHYGGAYGGGAMKQYTGYNQKQKDGYGGAAVKQKTSSYSYGDCDAGYGSHYGGGAAAYGYQHEHNAYGGGYPLQYGGGYGYEANGTKASKTEFAGGGYNNQFTATPYCSESSDSESDSDESDCEEEAFPPRGGYGYSKSNKQGGVYGYGAAGAYSHDKHGGGGVSRYEAYEKHEELAGGRRYEAYHRTTQYTGGGGGGYGYGGTCPPPNNSHLLRYGA